jgi:hypothetical protein
VFSEAYFITFCLHIGNIEIVYVLYTVLDVILMRCVVCQGACTSVHSIPFSMRLRKNTQEFLTLSLHTNHETM